MGFLIGKEHNLLLAVLKIAVSTKQHRLLLLMMALSLFLYMGIVPTRLDPRLRAVISLQEGKITEIDTPRKPRKSFKPFTLFFDEMNFPDSNTLTHYKLGPLGLGENIWVDIEANIDVERAGKYLFEISSDDGFRLTIDGKLICEFIKDRPLAETKGQTHLNKGKHKLRLSYFQGYGNTGLIGKYRLITTKTSYFIGESSDLMTFEKFTR